MGVTRAIRGTAPSGALLIALLVAMAPAASAENVWADQVREPWGGDGTYRLLNLTWE